MFLSLDGTLQTPLNTMLVTKLGYLLFQTPSNPSCTPPQKESSDSTQRKATPCLQGLSPINEPLLPVLSIGFFGVVGT